MKPPDRSDRNHFALQKIAAMATADPRRVMTLELAVVRKGQDGAGDEEEGFVWGKRVWQRPQKPLDRSDRNQFVLQKFTWFLSMFRTRK